MGKTLTDCKTGHGLLTYLTMPHSLIDSWAKGTRQATEQDWAKSGPAQNSVLALSLCPCLRGLLRARPAWPQLVGGPGSPELRSAGAI